MKLRRFSCNHVFLPPPERGRTKAALMFSKGAMRKLNAHGGGGQADHLVKVYPNASVAAAVQGGLACACALRMLLPAAARLPNDRQSADLGRHLSIRLIV
jgi:hypothetical protein